MSMRRPGSSQTDDSPRLLDDGGTYVAKKNFKKWIAVTNAATKNKIEFTGTLSYTASDGVIQELCVRASKEMLLQFHACVPIDDDDKVISFNDYYQDMKEDVLKVSAKRAARVMGYQVCESVY